MLFWQIIKTIAEMVALCYLGMLVVGAFNWSARHGNPIYKLLDVIASPFTKLARFITPKAVGDGHTRVVGFFLVALLWMVSVFELAQHCRENPYDAYCVKKLGAPK